jgi:hypothetical protein
MTQSTWQARYGTRRRQIDRALLAELERQISSPGNATPPQDVNFASTATRTPKTQEQASWLDRLARNRIAQAFGRPPG